MPGRHHAAQAEIELPLVTIMIPTYGQEKVVLDAVDSALAQDYPHLEVIVADDASPDKTAAAVATRRDSRLRYHRNPVNLGRVANYRNTLYNLANGDWVVNLDGDDYYTDTGFIRAAVTLALREPEILVVMGSASQLGSMDRSEGVPGDRAELIVSGQQFLYEIAYGKLRFFHLAALYRRREALLTGFFRIDTISSDLESLSRLALKGKVAFLNRIVGVWRTTEHSASQTYEWDRLLSDLEIWPAVFRDAVALGMPAAVAGVLQRRIIALYAYTNLSRLITLSEWIALKNYVHHFLMRYGLGMTVYLATRWRLYAKALWRCLLGRSSRV